MAKARKRDFKRIFMGACTHCGHRTGLTPPGWQLTPMEDEPRRMKWLKIQRECWKWFSDTIRSLRPFDCAVWNGDLIDGTGHRSGGTELICTDRNEQIHMACKVVQEVNASKNVFIHGTPYHTGEQEDMEDIIASHFGERGHDHEWIEEAGVVWSVKHFVSSSSNPYGRITPLSKEEVWNLLWAESDYAPRADYIVRAHVHYTTGGWRFSGKKEVNFFTLPALQGMGTKFGSKKCSGLVDYGFHVFDVTNSGSVSWDKYIAFVKAQKVHTLKLSTSPKNG